MSSSKDPKHVAEAKRWVEGEGKTSVIFEGGHDSRFIKIGTGDEKSWSREAKECLQSEIANKLKIPWNGEQQVTGEGVLDCAGGAMHLSYHLKDVAIDLSLAQEQLPIPDVAHVRLETPSSFPDFDFEIRLGVSSCSHEPRLWYEKSTLKTIPDKLASSDRNALIELLTPVVGPAVDVMKEPNHYEGDIVPVALSMIGYYWCSTKEIYYSLELDRTRVRRRIFKGSVTLFD